MTNEERCNEIVDIVRSINPDTSIKNAYVDGSVYIFCFGDEGEAMNFLTEHKKLNEINAFSKIYDWFDSWMRDGDYYVALGKD